MRLVNMRPCFARYNFVNRCLRYVELFTQRRLTDATCGIDGTNLAHQISGQLRIVTMFATRYTLWIQTCSMLIAGSKPTFILRICRIVSTSTQKQMARIHAAPIITAMKNALTVRDWPVVDLPRQPMSTDHSGTLTTVSNDPIPVSVIWSLPKPTLAGRIYTFPEAVFNWAAGILTGHSGVLSRLWGVDAGGVTSTARLPLSLIISQKTIVDHRGVQPPWNLVMGLRHEPIPEEAA